MRYRNWTLNANDRNTSKFHVCLSKLGICKSELVQIGNQRKANGTYLAASICTRCLWWRIRVAVPRAVWCLYTFPWSSRCRWAAFCTGWPPRRTGPSMSAKKKTEKWGIRDREKMVSNEQTKKKDNWKVHGFVGYTRGLCVGKLIHWFIVFH